MNKLDLRHFRKLKQCERKKLQVEIQAYHTACKAKADTLVYVLDQIIASDKFGPTMQSLLESGISAADSEICEIRIMSSMLDFEDQNVDLLFSISLNGRKFTSSIKDFCDCLIPEETNPCQAGTAPEYEKIVTEAQTKIPGLAKTLKKQLGVTPKNLHFFERALYKNQSLSYTLIFAIHI